MIYSINQCSVAEMQGDYPNSIYCGSSSYQYIEGEIIRKRKNRYADNLGFAKLGVYATQTAAHSTNLFPFEAYQPKPPTSQSPANVTCKSRKHCKVEKTIDD